VAKNEQKTCFNVERGKEKHSENHEPTFARLSGDTPGAGYSEIRSTAQQKDPIRTDEIAEHFCSF
jgi:hypothetical protein